MFFFDINGNNIYSHAMTIASGGEADGMVDIFCMTGYHFFAVPVPSLLVKARVLGDLDWVSIEETPIVLTPYNGLKTRFELQLITDVVTKRKRVQPDLRVTKI